MSKSANGRGTVAQRANGRWEARIRLRVDGESKRFSVSGETQEQALARLKELEARVQSGTPARDTRQTVAQWFADWVEGPLAESERRQNTQDQYETLVKVHAIPIIGKRPLAEVRPANIRAVLKSTTLAASSKRSLYAAMRAMFSDAVSDDLIARNPVESVKRPRVGAAKPRAVDPSHMAKLIEESREERLHYAMIVLVTTGVRRGELLGLKWEDIDLENRRIHVTGQITRSSKGLCRSAPKSERGRRYIPIPELTVAAFKMHRQAQRFEQAAASKWRNTGLVFCSKDGGPIEPRSFSRWYAKIARKSGLKSDVGVHVTRHTASNSLVASSELTQASLKDMADLLGNDPRILLSTYSAAVSKRQRSAIDHLADSIESYG